FNESFFFSNSSKEFTKTTFAVNALFFVPSEFPKASTSSCLLLNCKFLAPVTALLYSASALSFPPLTQCGTMHSCSHVLSAPLSCITPTPHFSAFTICDEPLNLPPICLVK